MRRKLMALSCCLVLSLLLSAAFPLKAGASPRLLAEYPSPLRAAAARDPGAHSYRRVPILMYHSLTEDPQEVSDMQVTVQSFRAQMEALRDKGCHTVLFGDLYAYVYKGTPLPKNPVVLTFDDGYQNNLTLAAPILQEFGFQAEIAVIGCSAGKSTYKDTGVPILPHFSMEEAQPWVEAGVVHLHPHSYDMHQVSRLDGENCRRGVLSLPGESEAQYAEALQADYLKDLNLLAQAGPMGEVRVFTYPYGKYSAASERALKALNVSVTVTTNTGTSKVVRGDGNSLRLLPRFLITDDVTPAKLRKLIGQK